MGKVQISGTLITLDIFRCSVLVIVSKNEESIIKGLPELYKHNGWEDPDRTIELIKKDHCDEDDKDLCERGSVLRSQTHCANDQDFGVTENMAEHNTK